MGYVKVIHSGTLVEVFTYEKNLPIRRKKRAKDTFGKRNSEARPRALSSIARARSSFKRLVRINLTRGENPSLYTFTMHQKLPYGTSSRIFTRFAYRLGNGRGTSFRYIAVPEFQKRGAVHWHVLIWGLPQEYACKGSWVKNKRSQEWFFNHECEAGRQCERRTRVISRLWLRGFCDGVVTDGHPKIASYLTKYLSKSMHDKRTVGAKSYHSSRNILRPMHVETDSEAIQAILSEHVIPDVKPLTQRTFPTKWLGKVDYKQYETSYDCKENSSDDSQSHTEGGGSEDEW